MTLAIVIPCHNDAADLRRLLGQLLDLAVAEQIIVVDDGSEQPVCLPDVSQRNGVKMRLLRNKVAQGPGRARNMGLQLVTTEHVLFLDADDLPTRDLPDLMADLEGQEFDFCLFQHHDTRREREQAWGQPVYDHALWRAAGCDLGALQRVEGRARSALVQTANYPWNKIYRAGFLRDHQIGCSEILLHEDIELHWRSFLCAQTILCSDRVGVIHFVAADGARLTNHRGRERLEVFSVLPGLVREIRDTGAELYEEACLVFLLGLVDWMRSVIAPDIQSELDQRARQFFCHSFDRDLLKAHGADKEGAFEVADV